MINFLLICAFISGIMGLAFTQKTLENLVENKLVLEDWVGCALLLNFIICIICIYIFYI